MTTDFTNDKDKMHDFYQLTKDEFLKSYSYLSEQEYMATVNARLSYLKKQIAKECISYAEITELQSLAKFIDKSDTQLLEWAGVNDKHEQLRNILIKYDCKEYGDSIIDEISELFGKEFECENKDENGNACWNCESGFGVCGDAKDDKTLYQEVYDIMWQGWDEPSLYDQKESVKKAIDTICNDKNMELSPFLIELRDFIQDYIDE